MINHIKVFFHFFYHRPSTILGFVIWGVTGFMAQPTVASFLVHFLIAPFAIAFLIFVSHWEGKRDYRKSMADEMNNWRKRMEKRLKEENANEMNNWRKRMEKGLKEENAKEVEEQNDKKV